MAKVRIGHFAEAQILEALGVDMIDESEGNSIELCCRINHQDSETDLLFPAKLKFLFQKRLIYHFRTYFLSF